MDQVKRFSITYNDTASATFLQLDLPDA